MPRACRVRAPCPTAQAPACTRHALYLHAAFTVLHSAVVVLGRSTLFPALCLRRESSRQLRAGTAHALRRALNAPGIRPAFTPPAGCRRGAVPRNACTQLARRTHRACILQASCLTLLSTPRPVLSGVQHGACTVSLYYSAVPARRMHADPPCTPGASTLHAPYPVLHARRAHGACTAPAHCTRHAPFCCQGARPPFLSPTSPPCGPLNPAQSVVSRSRRSDALRADSIA